jgi:hypothetical protein
VTTDGVFPLRKYWHASKVIGLSGWITVNAENTWFWLGCGGNIPMSRNSSGNLELAIDVVKTLFLSVSNEPPLARHHPTS